MGNEINPKAHVVLTPIGYFAFDDNKKIILYKDFNTNKKAFVQNIEKMGYVVSEDEFAKKVYRENFRELAKELKISESDEELNKILINFGISFSKKRMRISRDKIVIKIFDLSESFEKAIAPIRERFKEIIWLLRPGAKLNDEEINKILNEIEKEVILKEKDGNELKIVLKTGETIKNLISMKDSLRDYSKKEVKNIAPNLSFIAGEDVALMLLSLAGSLENLSKMASSTIQLLGSEKALFRHLKSRGKAKPPKYGVIYNCKYVKNAPKEMRGKIARIVASKISLAAKIDFYSGRDEKEKLKKELEEEIEKILR